MKRYDCRDVCFFGPAHQVYIEQIMWRELEATVVGLPIDECQTKVDPGRVTRVLHRERRCS